MRGEERESWLVPLAKTLEDIMVGMGLLVAINIAVVAVAGAGLILFLPAQLVGAHKEIKDMWEIVLVLDTVAVTHYGLASMVGALTLLILSAVLAGLGLPMVLIQRLRWTGLGLVIVVLADCVLYALFCGNGE